jgi:Tol biopolymer transport system component
VIGTGAPDAYEVAGDVSPDGSTVLFYSDRRVGSDSTGSQEIWSMGPDGSGKTSVIASDTANFDEQSPRFSPDGSKIVFVSRQGQDLSKPVVQTEIYIMNADGSARTQLTPAGEADDWPIFSRGGSKILFVSDRADPPTRMRGTSTR